MRRMRLGALLFLLCVVVAPTEPSAQETEETSPPGWIASIGTNVWFSEGDSKWEHRVPIVPGVTGGSRLTFRDISSKVVSVDADVLLWRKFVLTASGGWGAVDGGDLIDEDFVNGVNFSRTRSSIDDGRTYFANLHGGIRLAEYWADTDKRYGFVDLLVGYQWWQDKYVAFGVSPGGIPTSTKAITETWTWHGVRVGGRSYFPFPYGLGVRGNVFFFPWTSVQIDDIHPLRTDLKHNPSVALDAAGGFGFQLEGAITYTFWRGLGVEAGYRYWQVKIKGGDVAFRPVGAPESDLHLKEVSSERHGPFVGLYYRF
jgi:hypothetical protein